MPKKIDLTGKKFGRLTVVEEAPRHHTSSGVPVVMWFCDCDCGTKKIIVGANALRQGKTVSCGCWNREKAKFPKPKNRRFCNYDLSGSFGKGWTNKGEEFWFDLDDYDLIKDKSWHIHHKYVTATEHQNGMNKEIYMHRLVMGSPDKKYDIDHIRTESKTDNRKNNLRIVTRSQNNKNKVLQKNNTSGVAGVKKASKSDKWEVYININKKSVYLGAFSDFNTAVKVRKAAEEEYYGIYSYDNSQKIFKEVSK